MDWYSKYLEQRETLLKTTVGNFPNHQLLNEDSINFFIFNCLEN